MLVLDSVPAQIGLRRPATRRLQVGGKSLAVEPEVHAPTLNRRRRGGGGGLRPRKSPLPHDGKKRSLWVWMRTGEFSRDMVGSAGTCPLATAARRSQARRRARPASVRRRGAGLIPVRTWPAQRSHSVNSSTGRPRCPPSRSVLIPRRSQMCTMEYTLDRRAHSDGRAQCRHDA